jgi:hypothetical protein
LSPVDVAEYLIAHSGLNAQIFRSSLSRFLTRDDKESNIKFICYKNKKSCNLLTRTLLEPVTQNSTEFTLWKTVIRNEQMSVMASSANIGRGEDKKFQCCFVYNSSPLSFNSQSLLMVEKVKREVLGYIPS